MSKKLNKRILSVSMLVSLLIITIILSSAWLADNGMSSQMGVTSYVHKSYFESGDGTAQYKLHTGYDDSDNPVFGTDADGNTYASDYTGEGCAYEIKYPVQLYYLAWLQELGFFNQPDNESGTIPTTYFYLSADLDMSGFVLPPIGTSQYPFTGNFDGNGHTISNLTIANNDASLTDSPDSNVANYTEIIGFFGVVGSLSNDGTVNGSKVSTSTDLFDVIEGTTYSYSSITNEVKNVTLDGTVITTSTSRSLMGVVAGYVNGTVENVKVSTDATLNKNGTVTNLSYTSNLSDYTLFGYVTDDYKDKSEAVFVKIDTPTESNSQYTYASQGSTAGWGGSIDMYGLLSRIDAVGRASAGGIAGTTKPQIVKTETVIVDPVANTKEIIPTSYYTEDRLIRSTSNSGTTTVVPYYYYSENAGSYHYYQSTYSNQPHNYLTGLNEIQQGKTVTTITYRTENGNYVLRNTIDYSCNGNYLNVSNNAVTGGTTAISHWTLDSNGYLSTDYDTSYLNVTNGTLSIGTTGSTKWTYSDSCLTCISNDTEYYLTYSNNAWTVLEKTYRRIKDGTTYMSLSNTSFNSKTTVTSAAKWYSIETDGGYQLYTYVNGTKYYLYHNGTTLSLNQTNAIIWILDSDRIHEKGDITNKISFNNGSWGYYPDSGTITLGSNQYYIYTISNNTNHYLSYTIDNSGNPSGITDVTNISNAKTWTFSSNPNNNFSGGTIKAGSSNYYLTCNNSSLSFSTTSYNWTKNNNKLYVSITSTGWFQITTNYYIRYNNGGWSTTTNSNSGSTLYFTNQITGTFSSATVTDPIGTNPITINRTNSTIKEIDKTTTTDRSGIVSYIPLTTVGTAEQMRAYTAGSSDTSIFDVALGNTGYIIGGLYDTGDTEKADVRISAYPIASINNSYNTTSKTFTNIYTINDSGKISVNITDGTYDTSKKFTRFNKSLNQLAETLEKTNTAAAGNAVYGIHFMNALISTDHLITATQVTVNGQTYENYELPEDSIDFNLIQKGYITLFAGSYHPSNDSLFSLNTIIRDENEKITTIKELKYIYASENKKDLYIYQYSDGTFSDGVSRASTVTSFTAENGSTYSKVYDLKWIGKSGYISGNQNQIYYFEIPVNAGEYALGSVSGATGAYLIYLDIAANAQTVNRATVVENFEETTNTYIFPTGATFANTDPSTLPIPSLLGNMTTGTNSINVSVNSNTTLTETGMTAISYVADGVTVNSNKTIADCTPSSTSVTKIRRTTYYDYNVANDSYTITEVEMKKIGNEDETILINAWQATYNEGVWTKGLQLAEDVPRSSVTDHHDAADGFAAYDLMDVGEGDNKETLRFEDGVFNSFSSGTNITNLRNSFRYQISDNTGSTITYTYTCTITEDFESAIDPEDLYTFVDGSYSIVVNTPVSVAIEPSSQTKCTIRNTVG